ncbi:hypothetical protein [Legionella sp. W05-934-2]|jgi:hypothetical protein|uniref:hypothetical protein n=1 Tax=Legionella sp. W05-934-2 TaxID=1198649 RepID=UPI003461A2D2
MLGRLYYEAYKALKKDMPQDALDYFDRSLRLCFNHALDEFKQALSMASMARKRFVQSSQPIGYREGLGYLLGVGHHQSFSKAMYILEALSKTNDAKSQYTLGYAYELSASTFQRNTRNGR